MPSRALTVGFEESVRQNLASRLEVEGLQSHPITGVSELEESLRTDPNIEVVILGPNADATKYLHALRQTDENLKVLALADGEDAIPRMLRLVQLGAHEVRQLETRTDELAALARDLSLQTRIDREKARARQNLEFRVQRLERHSWGHLIGQMQTEPTCQSAKMKAVLEQLMELRKDSMRGTPDEAPVLVTGPLGSGQESLARLVHLQSRRARQAWVSVQIQQIPKEDFETELFGQEGKTPGIFEEAHRGTLYLEGVELLPRDLQLRLLKWMTTKQFRAKGASLDRTADCRLILGMVQDRLGKIPPTLLMELKELKDWKRIQVPSLEERGQDILPLAQAAAMRCFKERGINFPGFSADAQEGLKNYSWPGNLQELVAVMYRAALQWSSINTAGKQIQLNAGLLSLGLSTNPESHAPAKLVVLPTHASVRNDFPAVTQDPFLGMIQDGYMALKKRWSDEFEKDYLMYALKRHLGNVSAAAREAKLDRSNFLRLLRRYDLKAQNFRKAGTVSEEDRQHAAADAASEDQDSQAA